MNGLDERTLAPELGVAWSLTAFELALVAMLAVRTRSATTQAALLLGAMALVTAAFAFFTLLASGRARCALAGAAGVAASAIAYAVLTVIELVRGESGLTAVFAFGALWTVFTLYAAWIVRRRTVRALILFWAGVGIGLAGLLLLPNAGAYVASAAGNDAMGGILVLAAPMLAALAVLAVGLVELVRRRMQASPLAEEDAA